MFRVLFLWLVLATTTSAMVLVDSRVLSPSQMEELGVHVQVVSPPSPTTARQLWITTTVSPTGNARTFRRLGYAILAKPLDADFASTDARKVGLRDAKKWADEVRGEISEKTLLHFRVSGDEVACAYVVVHFDLPAKSGIAVVGTYYLPLTLNAKPNPRFVAR